MTPAFHLELGIPLTQPILMLPSSGTAQPVLSLFSLTENHAALHLPLLPPLDNVLLLHFCYREGQAKSEHFLIHPWERTRGSL